MNSKGHLYISILKSAFRILSCVLALIESSVAIIAIGFLCAEVLGVVEELVDKR